MNKRIYWVICLAVLCTLGMLFLLGKMTFSLRAFEFQVALNFSGSGTTVLNLPPLGSLSARTHLTPINIVLDLRNINIDLLQEFIKDAPSSAAVIDEAKNTITKNMYLYVLQLLLLGVLGGLAGAVIVTHRRLKPALYGALTGLATVLLLLVMTISTYNPEGFRNPQYHGALKAAPWAVDLAESALAKINTLGEEMQAIAQNLYAVYEKVGTWQPLTEDKDDLLILHISDIHNNPAAHHFISQIVQSFPVSLVINTGDMTDFGTPLETQLLTGLEKLEVPYLFVPGNHDSPAVIKEIARYPQVQVLLGGIVNVQGLRILALADPASQTGNKVTADQDMVVQAGEEINRFWEEAADKPHITAVHNLNTAAGLIGRQPLILFGHTHSFELLEDRGTLLINAGTTGAAGIRGLQAAKEIPYTVALLHLKRQEQDQFIISAVDTIKVYSLEKGFTLERRLLYYEIKP